MKSRQLMMTMMSLLPLFTASIVWAESPKDTATNSILYGYVMGQNNQKAGGPSSNGAGGDTSKAPAEDASKAPAPPEDASKAPAPPEDASKAPAPPPEDASKAAHPEDAPPKPPEDATKAPPSGTNKTIEGKSAAGEDTMTVIDEGGNLKVIKQNKPSPAAPPAAIPPSPPSQPPQQPPSTTTVPAETQ